MNTVYVESFTNDDVTATVTPILVNHFSEGFSNAIARLAKVVMLNVEAKSIQFKFV